MRTLISSLCALLALVTLIHPAAAQKLRDKEQPRNAAVQCPYCMGEPELMAASGLLSHGPFEFSKGTTTSADELLLGYADLIWAETKHFRIGFGLSTIKVDIKDKDKIRAECARLREVLETVPEKPRTLDPWLRLHLIAMRMEDHYMAFQEFLGVTDSDFPPVPGTAWNTQGEFMGTGPYLGMNRPYELMILPNQGASTKWLRDSFGLTTKKPQRWHIVDLAVIQYTTHAKEGDLKKDLALHGNLVFNTTLMMSHGYKYYAYDMPVWLLEGLGHWWERQVSERYNTFNSGEGAVAEMTKKSDWQPPTRKLVNDDEAPSLASLVQMRGPSELTLDKHYTTWSMVDYLQTEHPGFLTKLMRRISGLTNEQHITDGSKLPDAHRDAFREELGMSYPQFDREWRAWVLENYRIKAKPD